MKRLFLVLSLLIVLAGGAGTAFYLYLMMHLSSPGPLANPTTVVVPEGASSHSIARLLAKNTIISEPKLYRLGLRLSGQGTALKAGEFYFPARVSANDVTAILVAGKTVLHKVTIAEGLTVYQIKKLLQSEDRLAGEITLEPEEGTLLPETYHFKKGDTKDDILKRMAEAMTKTLNELWEQRAADVAIKDKHEALILASIVERETAIPDERGQVAGVFHNRLEKRIRLQTDPTVIYAVSDGKGEMDRPIYKRDLKLDHPYNTYIIYGLPPGPICNPGRDAIAAALNPDKTKALYFVADGTGGHVFSNTLREHNNNVKKWRKIERSRKRK